MTLTLKEKKQIKEKLESMGIDLTKEPDYSCIDNNEFYEELMDKYGLCFYKGYIVAAADYMDDYI